MAVRVDEARHERPPGEVDDLGAGARERRAHVGAADGVNPAVADGHGVRAREAVVDGDHVSVDEKDVRLVHESSPDRSVLAAVVISAGRDPVRELGEGETNAALVHSRSPSSRAAPPSVPIHAVALISIAFRPGRPATATVVRAGVCSVKWRA